MEPGTATAAPASAPAAAFGTTFTSRMAVAWFRDGAWSDWRIQDTQPLSLHPAAHVLHYASTCFEGLKAYRWEDGSIRVFRLQRHVERMRASARLLCLPVPEPALVTEMTTALVDACRVEVPAAPGALYLRPTLIGTMPNIGAAAGVTTEAMLYVLASPVGDYFQGGARPLRILVDDHHLRAPPDFGMAKTGGNYASALRHIMQARETYGVDQVLFCPGGDVQETGASNFLLLSDDEILTKKLDGSFLHGVTRDSVLQLGARLGYRITERDLNVQELLAWIEHGEAALSGTAAVLAGVGTLVYHDRRLTVGDGELGRNTLRLRDALTEIQAGRAPDPFGWLTEV